MSVFLLAVNISMLVKNAEIGHKCSITKNVVIASMIKIT